MLLATTAVTLLPDGVTGTAAVSMVKRSKKGSAALTYVPTVKVGELEYHVAIGTDGETPVALRFPKNAQPAIPLMKKSEEGTA